MLFRACGLTFLLGSAQFLVPEILNTGEGGKNSDHNGREPTTVCSTPFEPLTVFVTFSRVLVQYKEYPSVLTGLVHLNFLTGHGIYIHGVET